MAKFEITQKDLNRFFYKLGQPHIKFKGAFNKKMIMEGELAEELCNCTRNDAQPNNKCPAHKIKEETMSTTRCYHGFKGGAGCPRVACNPENKPPQPIEEIDIVTDMSSSAPSRAVIVRVNELIRAFNNAPWQK